MRPPWKIQFAMGTLMMFVLAAASASALFTKVMQYSSPIAGAGTWAIDVPILVLLAIILTAITLAAWKGHSLNLTMLQLNLACLGWLVLIWFVEAKYERAVRYWFEAGFAVIIALPLLIRRGVKSSLPRGPKRDWWKNACEAVAFSYLNMLLVIAGVLLQLLVYWGTTGLTQVIAEVSGHPAPSVGVGTPTPNAPTKTGTPPVSPAEDTVPPLDPAR